MAAVPSFEAPLYFGRQVPILDLPLNFGCPILRFFLAKGVLACSFVCHSRRESAFVFRLSFPKGICFCLCLFSTPNSQLSLSRGSALKNPLKPHHTNHLPPKNTWHTRYAPRRIIKVGIRKKVARHRARSLHLSRKTAKGSTRMRIPPPPYAVYHRYIYISLCYEYFAKNRGWGTPFARRPGNNGASGLIR